MLGILLVGGSMVALAIHIVAFALRGGPMLVIPKVTSIGLFVGMPALYGAGVMWNSIEAQVIGAVVAVTCLSLLVLKREKRERESAADAQAVKSR